MTCPFCGAAVGNAATCPLCGANLAAPPTSPALPAGTRLLRGKYTLGKVLGQGGFGITYMGADTALNRPVAIKELFPQGCQRNGTIVQPAQISPADFADMRQRFLDEARLLASFSHSGIVRVYEVFEENNTAYMVMEFLRGRSLAQLVQERGGALGEQEAVAYILKVCEALDVVHQRGYLHRDIKPENIILCEDGKVILIDFGAARAYMAGKRMTVMLTPGFAPLEQYVEQARWGVYTDIYALGATLYYLLTGVVPVSAEYRAAGVELRSVRELNGGVSEQVDEAVMRALAMREDDRPQSVGEFVQLLSSPTPPAPVPTPVPVPPPLSPPAPMSASSRGCSWGTVRLALLGGVGLLVVGLCLNSFFGRSEPPSQVSGSRMERAAGSERSNPPSLSPASPPPPPPTPPPVPPPPPPPTPPPSSIVVSSAGELVRAIEAVKVGGKIILQSGVYRLRKPLVIAKSVSIEGAGYETTKLVFVGGAIYVPDEAKCGGIKFTGDGRLAIRGVSLEYAGRELGVDVISIKRGILELTRCRVSGGVGKDGEKNTWGGGVWVYGTAKGVIRSCIITGNFQGIVFSGSAQGEVEGNICRNNGFNGIEANNQSHLVARNNTCEGNKQNGIGLFGEARGEVEGNICRNNGYYGIAAEWQSHLVARNNTCEGNKHSGIALFGSAQGEVEDNTCRNNGIQGIAANDQSRLVARNNTCERNKYFGIALWGSAQGEVEGNTCRNNGGHGIVAVEQSRLVARNNTCEGNKNCGIALWGSAQGELKRNTSANNTWYGIYISPSVETVSLEDNILYDNPWGDIHDARRSSK